MALIGWVVYEEANYIADCWQIKLLANQILTHPPLECSSLLIYDIEE